MPSSLPTRVGDAMMTAPDGDPDATVSGWAASPASIEIRQLGRGDKVGRYEIERTLGRGEAGERQERRE